MADRLTKEDVRRVAELAHLELTTEELELFARQLAGILAYADEVQRIDTTGVPPTFHPLTRHTADRADDLRPGLPRRDVLANAPEAAADAGLFKVPRVIG